MNPAVCTAVLRRYSYVLCTSYDDEYRVVVYEVYSFILIYVSTTHPALVMVRALGPGSTSMLWTHSTASSGVTGLTVTAAVLLYLCCFSVILQVCHTYMYNEHLYLYDIIQNEVGRIKPNELQQARANAVLRPNDTNNGDLSASAGRSSNQAGTEYSYHVMKSEGPQQPWYPYIRFLLHFYARGLTTTSDAVQQVRAAVALLYKYSWLYIRFSTAVIHRLQHPSALQHYSSIMYEYTAVAVHSLCIVHALVLLVGSTAVPTCTYRSSIYTPI